MRERHRQQGGWGDSADDITTYSSNLGLIESFRFNGVRLACLPRCREDWTSAWKGTPSPWALWIPQEGNELEFKPAGPKQGALSVRDLAQGTLEAAWLGKPPGRPRL